MYSIMNDIAFMCAGKAARSWCSIFDDLYSVALVKGVRCIQYIDKNPDNFETDDDKRNYISKSIRGVLLQYVKEDFVIRVPCGNPKAEHKPIYSIDKYDVPDCKGTDQAVFELLQDLETLALSKKDRRVIAELLNDNNVTEVAKNLGITRPTVYSTIKNIRSLYAK